MLMARLTLFNILHRSKLDPNREEDKATDGDPTAKEAYVNYHNCIHEAKARLGEEGPGLLLDIHGQDHQYNM